MPADRHAQSLRTPRLLLRQWRPEDRVPFAELNADPDVMAYFPQCLNRSQSDALAARCEDMIARDGWGFWAVEHRGDGAFLGFVGLHRINDGLPFAPCVEIGWRLAARYWERGYATEAAQAALSFAFNELQLAEVVSFTTVNNRRSRAVMERLGMSATPDTFNHPALPPDSPLRQHCLYRITAQQWAISG